MSAAVMLARPIGAARPPEYSRVVFSVLEEETATAVKAARTPEGSELHRESLIEHHKGQVAAGAQLPIDTSFRCDAWAEAAVESLAGQVEAARSKIEHTEERMHDFEEGVALLEQPRSWLWHVAITVALLALTAAVVFASARLVTASLDLYALGSYVSAAYGQGEAGTANFVFMVALLISGVVAGSQVVAVLMTSGRLGALSKAGMIVADIMVAGAFFGMRWAAGSTVQSAALVLLEGAILIGFSALLLGASVVLRTNAGRREAWRMATTQLGVLRDHVERARKHHAELTIRLGDQVQVFEERESGVRRSQLTERMVESTTNAAYLTAQAELVAKMMEAE